ncbi:uncharacterized protein LOC142573896 isoform X2 [Dermacentor variabilis]|uniref:uncharacterized protein LOC142573896 isoform X2 n=1 Tax=Dermacentor variabilis TaxID=34621 RepID=UPI003F5AF3C9
MRSGFDAISLGPQDVWGPYSKTLYSVLEISLRIGTTGIHSSLDELADRMRSRQGEEAVSDTQDGFIQQALLGCICNATSRRECFGPVAICAHSHPGTTATRCSNGAC